MYFKNRIDAGRLLAQALIKYKGSDVVVYAVPRGGVVTAVEIARILRAPLDLIIVRKIGHPFQPEYAIGAVAEDGHTVRNEKVMESVDKNWLKNEIEAQRQEAKRRREKYLRGRKDIPVEGKTAILIDDGIATGLTIRLAVKELKHRNPKKIVVAVPVSAKATADKIKQEVDEFVALDMPGESEFLGAVGSYYDEFFPVEDAEVIALVRSYDREFIESLHPLHSALQKLFG